MQACRGSLLVLSTILEKENSAFWHTDAVGTKQTAPVFQHSHIHAVSVFHTGVQGLTTVAQHMFFRSETVLPT
jgi:hypothetical protein